MTDDQPTTQLPAPRRQQPSAWSDDATRRVANRQVRISALLGILALVAAGGAAAVPVLDHLDQPWGLPVMVAAAGVAGGALAGAITLLVLWMRLRSTLRRGSWEAGELVLGEDRDAQLSYGTRAADVWLQVSPTVLGEPGDHVGVEVCFDGDLHLITVPPSRRMLRAVTSEPTDPPSASPISEPTDRPDQA